MRVACFKLNRMAFNLFGTGDFRWLFVFSLYCERLVVIAYNAITAASCRLPQYHCVVLSFSRRVQDVAVCSL